MERSCSLAEPQIVSTEACIFFPAEALFSSDLFTWPEISVLIPPNTVTFNSNTGSRHEKPLQNNATLWNEKPGQITTR
jgi:hypothetical protein